MLSQAVSLPKLAIRNREPAPSVPIPNEPTLEQITAILARYPKVRSASWKGEMVLEAESSPSMPFLFGLAPQTTSTSHAAPATTSSSRDARPPPQIESVRKRTNERVVVREIDIVTNHAIGLDWIGLAWLGLDWLGLDWIDGISTEANHTRHRNVSHRVLG